MSQSKTQRKPGLIMVGFHATKEERDLLREAAEKAGFENLADYLRWVARQQPVPIEGYSLADGSKQIEQKN